MNNLSSIGRREVLAATLAGAATAALDASPQQPAPKKVRYGVVGTGPRSTGFHLPCIKRFLPEIEVVALCDITPENLQKGHAIFPDAATYDDHQRMLGEQKDLDAVVIIIPNYVHAEVAVHALEAGKHVLVEKPMAIHLAEADRMIAAARKNNRVLQVGLQNRFSEGYRHMAAMIREGAIGDVEMVFASVFRSDWNKGSWQYTDPVTGKKTNWRFLSKTCGSALLEDGIHELDVIHWLVDSQPTRIHAQGGNAVFKDRETIDNAGLLVEFANGARLTFGYSIFTPLPNPRQMRIFGSKGEIHVEGRGDGAVVVQPYHGQAERVPFTNLRADEAEWKDAGNFDVNTTREHQAFAKSITTGAPVVVSGQVGRDAIHISLAAERSLRNGRSYRWQDEADI